MSLPLPEGIEREDIRAVAESIAPYVRRTPVLDFEARDLDPSLRGALSVKLEFLQRAGSFKARGAFANLLTREVPAAGIVAASGGNHGAAVAYAARELGVRATIFVPTIASPRKVALIRACGATLVQQGERYADARAASERFREETGALALHAFDQRETLLGQGTVGLELEAQAPALDTLLVAVGGGGLLGGIAAWYRGRVRLVAVEPEGAPTLYRALEAGAPVDAEMGSIAADSLAPARVGSLMFPFAQAFVERAVLVSDEALARAQRALWDALRVVLEPGGATAAAALLSGAYKPAPGERVGVLLCGSNPGSLAFLEEGT